MNPPKTWTTWRWALLWWWCGISAMLFIVPNYHKQIPHYGLGTLYSPDTLSYTLLLITFYAILPLIYWLLSWAAWLRKHFLIKWLLIIPVHLLMTAILGMAAMHNSSVAFFLLIWTMLIGTAIHVFIVPLIWWKLPRT